MRAATGFHDDQADRSIGEPALHLGAGQALFFDDAPIGIGDRDLEHRLRKIHSHDRQRSGSIHVGLSSVER